MKLTEKQKKRYLVRQPKGKKYLAVLYSILFIKYSGVNNGTGL